MYRQNPVVFNPWTQPYQLSPLGVYERASKCGRLRPGWTLKADCSQDGEDRRTTAPSQNSLKMKGRSSAGNTSSQLCDHPAVRRVDRGFAGPGDGSLHMVVLSVSVARLSQITNSHLLTIADRG